MSPELSRLVTKLSNHLCRHVVPIYEDDDQGRPRQYGTGLLVAGPQGSFLVSAAHVLDPIRHGRDVYIHPHPKLKLHLDGRHWLTDPGEGRDRSDDWLDVGVLRLDGPAVPPYPAADKFPLPIDELVPGPTPRMDNQYCILGFPGSGSRVDRKRKVVEAKPYASLCHSASADRYASLGLSTSSNIVFEFNRRSVSGPAGKKQSFPKLGGMSGSPVWLLWDNEGRGDPARTPAVAILTEYRESDKVLVGTDVRFVLDMIRRAT